MIYGGLLILLRLWWFTYIITFCAETGIMFNIVLGVGPNFDWA